MSRTYADKHFHKLMGGILFLAIALRILAFLSLKQTIYFDYLLSDEQIYYTWATKIMDGTYQSASYHGFAPLFAYLSAIIYKIFAPDILYVRLLNIFLGVMTCYFVCLTGRALAGPLVGLVSGLLASLYKPFIFYSIVPLKTALSVFLFSAVVWLFLSGLKNLNGKSALSRFFFLGLSLGFMVNVRPNSLALIPLFIVLIFVITARLETRVKLGIRLSVFYIVGIACAITPFSVQKYLTSGRFSVTTPQAGFALFIGNNLENPVPYYRPVPFATPVPDVQGAQMVYEASRRQGRKLAVSEASAFFTKEAFRLGHEHPLSFSRKLFQKLLVIFNRFEAGDHYDIDFISNFATFFKAPFLSFSLIMPFGMAAMLVTAFRSARSVYLFLVCALYGSTLVLFFSCARFRLPLLAAWIPFAALGVHCLVSFIKSKKWVQFFVFIALLSVFILIEHLPVNGTDDTSPYYSTHAVILDSKGFEKEAIDYWKISSEMNKSYSVYADLSLALKSFDRGDLKEGLRYLEKIPDGSFAAAQKYEFLGDLMQSQGQDIAAVTAYEKSLAINSGRRETWYKLARVYDGIDGRVAAQKYKQLEYVSSFYTHP